VRLLCVFAPESSFPERDAGVSNREEPPNALCACVCVCVCVCACVCRNQHRASRTQANAPTKRSSTRERRRCSWMMFLSRNAFGGKLSQMSGSSAGANTRFQSMAMPPLRTSLLMRASTTSRARAGLLVPTAFRPAAAPPAPPERGVASSSILSLPATWLPHTSIHTALVVCVAQWSKGTQRW